MTETNGIDYKAKCEEYERRMGIGENDPAKDGYLVLIQILRSQNEYLKKLPEQFKSLITSDDSAKKVEYKNAKDLWEGLPKMISSVASLKYELKMEGSKEDDKKDLPITPQSIAFSELPNH